jgi:hypothetical protein
MKNLLTAMNAIMSEVGYVQKGKKNAFHGYKYAGEADLLEALRPALVKHGLLLIPSTDGAPVIDEHGNTHVVMSYTLAHTSGEVWPHPLRMAGCGGDKNKNGVGDKGTYKAITGANKYLLFKLFQIETGDDPERDGAADDSEPAQPAPPAPAQRAAPPPAPAAAYILINPHDQKDKKEFSKGQPFLMELEHMMAQGNAADWWAVNGSTAKGISRAFPQAVKKVQQLEAMASGGLLAAG